MGAQPRNTPPGGWRPPRTHLLLQPEQREEFVRAVDFSADAVVIDAFRRGEDPDLALLWACIRALVDARGRMGWAPQLWLRVHPAFTPECADELAQLAGIEEGLILPKVRSAEDVQWVADRAPAAKVLPVIENQDALSRVTPIAGHPAVCRLGFSARGLAASATTEDGLLPPDEALVWQRRIVVAAAAAAGLPGPVNAVQEARTFEAEAFIHDAEQALRSGFTGQCVTSLHQLACLRARLPIGTATG
ncbi:hypothetical protein [Streptomyces sp. NPDC060022]|uniref:hypothetical protein n=1 Tax=Streptomyces sp. NPDC060022 TaxID=3347039 RepID=UPI0036ACA927